MATNVISCVVGNADYAEASNGILLPLNKLAQTLAYNTNGTFNYLQVTYQSNVYRRTFSYDSVKRVTGLTLWTLQ